MGSKIASVIFKDVTGANESNRVSFIVRINSLMMCVYFLIWISVFGITARYINTGICFLGMSAYAFSTYLTYKNRNTAAVLLYSAVTVV